MEKGETKAISSYIVEESVAIMDANLYHQSVNGMLAPRQ